MDKRLKDLEDQVRRLKQLLSLLLVAAGAALLMAQAPSPQGTKQDQVWAKLVIADQIAAKQVLVGASPVGSFTAGLELASEPRPLLRLRQDGAVRLELQVDMTNTPLIKGHDPDWRYPAERPLTLK